MRAARPSQEIGIVVREAERDEHVDARLVFFGGHLPDLDAAVLRPGCDGADELVPHPVLPFARQPETESPRAMVAATWRRVRVLGPEWPRRRLAHAPDSATPADVSSRYACAACCG